ncbi:hypothetical protein MPHL21000_13945 [Mycolicibacterium phlei DSM 43239 = CCUG 21000]|uniref:Uncharacterized protein n=1 Tax=Mycolicibacterium phlei DSM 43239 = CCUG 21000 TaxID=1226750 RepID=A0A5N5V3W2_MYCPH|nr:hypothetical protein MPHL21000_13945 [Mycolicibacterium phlei DSM 43239 = CCUG 21000]
MRGDIHHGIRCRADRQITVGRGFGAAVDHRRHVQLAGDLAGLRGDAFVTPARQAGDVGAQAGVEVAAMLHGQAG